MKLLDEPIFTLSDKRHVNFSKLCRIASQGSFLTIADEGDRIGEKAVRAGTALVLSERTLRRFNASNPQDFVTRLCALITDHPDLDDRDWALKSGVETLQQTNVLPHISESPLHADDRHEPVRDSDLNDRERDALYTLRDINHGVVRVMSAALDRKVQVRTLSAGESATASAWTDGETRIFMNRDVLLKAASSGMPGLLSALMIMFHEYLHDTANPGAHSHDHDFYEAFHELVIDHGEEIQSLVGTAATRLYRRNKKRTGLCAATVDKFSPMSASEPATIARAAA